MPTGVTKVLVKIDLGDHLQNKGELSFAFDREPNNVSKKCVQQADGTWLLSEKTRRNYGSNLYMYGNELRPANVVGKDLSYDGVRFDETAADGSLDITLTVTASGNDGLVQGIVVYGDFSALQWATEAVLDDGTTIKSDDEIWAIRWNTPAKTHTVTFKKWNRANYNACFTHFTVLPSVLEFNKSRVRHIESLSQCTGQRDTLWYGVIWNTGSVQIYDTDGEIYDYIRDGIIEDEQMPITIEAKGRYGSTVIQHHLNGSASYIKETRMMEIQLTNKLEQWDTLKYAGRALTEACSAWSLLVEVFETAGYSESDVEAMCDSLISVRHPVSGAETEMTVEAFFKGVTIPYPYLEESTFREAVTKFCQLGMLWCYCDDNDNIKFVSARPKMLQGERERAYKYPKSRIYGTTSTEVFLKNKIKALELSVREIAIDKSPSGYKYTFDIQYDLIDDGEPPKYPFEFNEDGSIKNLSETYQSNKYYVKDVTWADRWATTIGLRAGAYFIIDTEIDPSREGWQADGAEISVNFKGWGTDLVHEEYREKDSYGGRVVKHSSKGWLWSEPGYPPDGHVTFLDTTSVASFEKTYLNGDGSIVDLWSTDDFPNLDLDASLSLLNGATVSNVTGSIVLNGTRCQIPLLIVKSTQDKNNEKASWAAISVEITFKPLTVSTSVSVTKKYIPSIGE